MSEKQSTLSVEVITLIPEFWKQWQQADAGLIAKAFRQGHASLEISDLRSYGLPPRQQVDDTPYGGGAGMLLMVEPLHQAMMHAKKRTAGPLCMLSPRGERFSQKKAESMACLPGFTLICGRYAGVDERSYRYVDEVISIGDYVLSAGDAAAFCILDAVLRLRQGVLGNSQSLTDESFDSENLLEAPQYTKPLSYQGDEVPTVLSSGHHGNIALYRKKQRYLLTQKYRPDLLK